MAAVIGSLLSRPGIKTITAIITSLTTKGNKQLISIIGRIIIVRSRGYINDYTRSCLLLNAEQRNSYL